MVETMVPRVRQDVSLKEVDGAFVAEDATRRVRVPLDGLAVELFRILSASPSSTTELTSASEARPESAYSRIALFDRHILLDSAHARAQVEIARAASNAALWPRDELAQAPLDIAPDLVHECVACGAACNCPDIGPLTERDIGHIESVDWSPHIPGGAQPHELVGEVEVAPGETLTLTGSRHSRCIFLAEDKLCTIHRVLGYDKKPTICQQFPMTLTRTPNGVAPSFAMECRSWRRASHAAEGKPPAESGIRSLLAQGAPVLDVPLPVPVWHGHDWSFERWLAYRAEAMAAVRQARSVAEMAEAIARPLVDEMASLAEQRPDDEAYLAREAWGISPAKDDPTAGPVWFDATCRRLAGRLEALLDPLIESYRSAAEHYHALALDQILDATFMTLSHERLDDVARGDDEVDIWRDAVIAALQSHEPARRDTVMTGVANLVFRLTLGNRMAAHRARSAFRVKTTEQDVVDSMVVSTKMLRGTSLVNELAKLREDLVPLFLFNADSFTRGIMPAKVEYVVGSRILGVR